MFKLEKNKFTELVKNNKFIVDVKEIEYLIEPDILVSVNFDVIPPTTDKKIKGYSIKCGNFDRVSNKFTNNNNFLYYKNINDFINKFNITDYINVIKINEFYSLEEYYLDIEFNNANMEYIINKYNYCNKMSLVTLFLDSYSLSNDEASLAIAELKSNNLKCLKELYDRNNIKEGFDIIINNIKNECLSFKDKHYKEYGKDFQYSFICDHVGLDTIYSEPASFYWHAYHMLGNELDCIEQINKCLKNKENNKIIDKINDYKYLKDNFISYKITVNTYVTGGPLQIIYYFNFNDETKKYLLNFKDDYSFDNSLEDLALYKDDKIEYVSCTHEEFRCDYSKEGK